MLCCAKHVGDLIRTGQRYATWDSWGDINIMMNDLLNSPAGGVVNRIDMTRYTTQHSLEITPKHLESTSARDPYPLQRGHASRWIAADGRAITVPRAAAKSTLLLMN